MGGISQDKEGYVDQMVNKDEGDVYKMGGISQGGGRGVDKMDDTSKDTGMQIRSATSASQDNERYVDQTGNIIQNKQYVDQIGDIIKDQQYVDQTGDIIQGR